MQFVDRAVIRPKCLQRGDTIGIVAPSSPFDQKAFGRGIQVIREAGFSIYEAPDLLLRKGYLAGSDRQRAGQFNAMIADGRADAVMCARGGFGALRILDRLDFDAIGRQAKPLIGFSDITALHQAVLLKSGLATFHGPTVTTLARADEATLSAWYQALTNPKPLTLDLSGAVVLNPGKAWGPVRGGNLATLCHMLGTAYLEPFYGALLFLEDTGEALYRIDRMLTQMKMTGLVSGIAGLMLGSFKNCGEEGALYELVKDLFRGEDIPIVAGLDIGHGNCNKTIPLGIAACLDSGSGTLEFLTAAVEE